MKLVILTVFALIASSTCAPSQISNNNVGDIVTVGVHGSIDVNNQVDVTLINFILAILNQQLGIIVAPANEIEPANVESPKIIPEAFNAEEFHQQLPKITPENLEKLRNFLNSYQQQH